MGRSEKADKSVKETDTLVLSTLPKTWIFDLDGTLLDTSEGVISSVEKTIEHFGYEELTKDVMSTFIGPPISKSMVRIYGVCEDEGLEAMIDFRKAYTEVFEGEEMADLYKAAVYPGMIELLKELKKAGYKVGVATYKQEDQAKKLLAKKGMAELFDIIHGADPYGKLSKADVVSLSIKDLGALPGETVMVGDSDNDAVGAEGAGTLFLGVTYGFGFKSREDVDKYANIGVAGVPLEILDILNNRVK